MDKTHIYMLATPDYSNGVFAKFTSGAWYLVTWHTHNENERPVFTSSCAVSEMWASGAKYANDVYPIAEEFEVINDKAIKISPII